MATFDVMAWLETYRSGDILFVQVEQPKQTGACWTRTSILEGSQYKYGDSSGLLPYSPCSIPCSLAEGFPEKYVQKPKEGSVHINRILNALKEANLAFHQFSLISFRNNLNKICNTMTDPSSPWAIDGLVLSAFPHTTLLNIHPTEEKDYPDSQKYCYFGYKFETLSTGAGSEAVVDATSEFAMVVETQIQEMKCAICAEIDCYDPKMAATSPPPLSSLVELKTARTVESERQQKNAQRFKYAKWWFQSFIVGVPQIVLGYWSRDGTLTATKSIATHDLPSRALDGFNGYMKNQVWRPEQLLGFLHGVLDWMQGLLKMDMDKQYRFVYHPEQKLVIAELCPEGELSSEVQSVLT